MTFDEIVNSVLDRLNLTSLEARERIEDRVNDRYRRVTSSIGLVTSRRVVKDVTVDPTDPDSELPEIVITDIQKVLAVRYTGQNASILVLKEKTYDEVVNFATNTHTPRAWATKLMGPGEVRIVIDAFDPLNSLTLSIEAYEVAPLLEGTMEPYFPEDFHDILIEGAMSDELRKMEKPQLAQIAETNYQTRLSDLRYFIAKSAYLDIAQGKDKPGQLWYRPWFSRVSVWP